MKKNISLVIGAVAVLGMTPAIAATNVGARAASSADLTGGPAVRERTRVNYSKYETRTTSNSYRTQDAGNLYYTQPVKRSELYKQYDNSGRTMSNVRTSRAETVRTELKRKYFLAHPFFQPTKGKFGSVTDLGYAMDSYKVEFIDRPDTVGADGDVYRFSIGDTSAKWKGNTFSIKEDFSYGITDKVALMGMAQYDISKYKLDWADPTNPDDKMDDKDLSIYGIGGQFRFLDNSDWIAMASAYFQHQKDLANNFILELKAGYKVASSTIYGIARGWYVDFDGDSYGNGIEGKTADGDTATLFMAYKTDTSNAFYAEGGVGVFSVLDEDWTLNLEGIFGHYDWHNQLSLKAALGWQPNDWFALNLYAKTSVYDSANDKKVGVYGYNWYYDIEQEDGSVVSYGPAPEWVQLGQAKISDYRETKVGVQAIFMF